MTRRSRTRDPGIVPKIIAVLGLVETGVSIQAACRMVAVSRSTLYEEAGRRWEVGDRLRGAAAQGRAIRAALPTPAELRPRDSRTTR